MEKIIEKLKLIKRQPYDRHIEIYLGKSYLDNLLVKFDDKHIIEENNKNEIIDLVIDTIIKYFEKNGEIVKTKFKVGDKVWEIAIWKGKWCIIGQYFIEGIYYDSKKGIKYGLHLSTSINEENCFTTKEKAKKECDRRNNAK